MPLGQFPQESRCYVPNDDEGKLGILTHHACFNSTVLVLLMVSLADGVHTKELQGQNKHVLAALEANKDIPSMIQQNSRILTCPLLRYADTWLISCGAMLGSNSCNVIALLNQN